MADHYIKTYKKNDNNATKIYAYKDEVSIIIIKYD